MCKKVTFVSQTYLEQDVEEKVVILIKGVLCLGIFFYNGHPVRQVDVVGMVVQTKEREAFHSYGGKKSFYLCFCIYQPSSLSCC